MSDDRTVHVVMLRNPQSGEKVKFRMFSDGYYSYDCSDGPGVTVGSCGFNFFACEDIYNRFVQDGFTEVSFKYSIKVTPYVAV